MTLGINNGMIMIMRLMASLIIMEEFELSGPPELLYRLNRLLRTVRKYHSRCFLNNLKSSVLRSLLSQQTRPQQQDNLEMEFVGMCAQKIQAVFRGYIKRKYHLKAMEKVRRVKEKWGAVMLGWKTRQVFRCCKMVEEVRTINSKQKQVVREEETVAQSPNNYSLKKLQYLRHSLRDQIQQFIHRFYNLFQSKAWIYEPKVPRAMPKSNGTRKKRLLSQTSAIQTPVQSTEQTLQQLQTVQEVPEKPRRVREMIQKNRRGARPTRSEQEQIANRDEQKPRGVLLPRVSVGQQVPAEDRPIKAKGAYVLEQVNMVSQPIIQKQHQSQAEEEKVEEVDSKVAKAKRVDRAKMQKRQKYDPRKAIEQEKKKKKVSLRDIPQSQLTSSEAGQPQLKKEAEMPISKEKEAELKEGKVSQIDHSDGNSTRATVAYCKGTTKTKAEPKIDCWANRKTNRQKAHEEHRNTYRAIHSKDQEIAKSIEKIKRELTSDKPPERTWAVPPKEEEQPQRQIHKMKEVERRETVSMTSKKQGHKFIEEIESVYDNLYQNRLQKLLPKLTLLAAARQREFAGGIPVLFEGNSEVMRKVSENSFNSRFWLTANRLQKSFKEFDRF